MPKALFILDNTVYERIYPHPIYDEICSLVDVYAPPQHPNVVNQKPELLSEMELLFSSWTCPPIDEEFLALAPNLKMVFYGAGSIKHVVTKAFWERGIRITHAANANALIVAQFTLGQIIMSLKGVWKYMQQTRSDRTFNQTTGNAGLRKSKVGIIGLGLIGRHVCTLLQPFDVDILVYDPYIDQQNKHQLDIQIVDLETVFREAHVVSLHAPLTSETRGMINASHFELMLPNSTFINTARGAIVREDEMIAVLRERKDIFAILDVTHPEPPTSESEIYNLPNIILTPHIAGAIEKNETATMGDAMLQELRRYLKGEPLQWEINKEQLETMA